MSDKEEVVDIDLDNELTACETDADQAEEVADTDQATNTCNSLEDEIVKLKADLSDAKNDYLRLHAEWDNYKKRSKSEIETTKQYCLQGIIGSLLPITDNFERAFSVEANSEEAKVILQGMKMIKQQLEEVLQKEGVKEIEALGTQFDPHFHQGVMQDEDENKPSGEVLEVLQKGYTLKDRVVRPAMVKVNK